MNKEKIAEAFGRLNDQMITDALDYKCERRQIVMNKKKLITIAIAAVVAVLLTVSVAAAATYTNLVGEERAFDTASAYVIRNADTEAEQTTLANYIIAGLTYDKSSEEASVNLRFSGLRPVYDVKFKVGGYAYEVRIDAKTEVVLECKKEIDEGWEDYLASEIMSGNEKAAEIGTMADFKAEISNDDATLIALDYTGISEGGHYGCDSVSATVVCSANQTPEQSDCYIAEIYHGGYKYTVTISSETGEVLNCEHEESDEEGADERHLHEGLVSGHIGRYKAKRVAIEYFLTQNPSFDEDSLFIYDYLYFRPEDGGTINIGTERFEDADCDIYTEYFQLNGGTIRTIVFINADTGEILRTVTETTDPTSSAGANQTLSSEAPEGMLSETDVAIIALTDAELTEPNVHDLTVVLEDGIYRIRWEFAFAETVYMIDAKTGEILSTEGVTPRDYIGTDTALDIVFKEKGISKEYVSNVQIETGVQSDYRLYYITFTYHGIGCSFDVNALDGTIMGYAFPFANISDNEVFEGAYEIGFADLIERGIDQADISHGGTFYDNETASIFGSNGDGLAGIVCVDFKVRSENAVYLYGISLFDGSILRLHKIDCDTGDAVIIIG